MKKKKTEKKTREKTSKTNKEQLRWEAIRKLVIYEERVKRRGK